jgi:hypothetical protein
MKSCLFLLLYPASVVGFAVLTRSSPEIAKEIHGTGWTVGVVAYVLLFPVGWLLGAAFRKFTHPDMIFTQGAMDMAKQRLFWVLGPQCIGALLAAFASYAIGVLVTGDPKLLESVTVPFATLTVTPPPTQKAKAPESSIAAAQQEAIRRYPDLGVAGSKLNTEFVARYKRYQQERPEYFRDTSWPIRLAEECFQATRSQQPKASP